MDPYNTPNHFPNFKCSRHSQLHILKNYVYIFKWKNLAGLITFNYYLSSIPKLRFDVQSPELRLSVQYLECKDRSDKHLPLQGHYSLYSTDN